MKEYQITKKREIWLHIFFWLIWLYFHLVKFSPSGVEWENISLFTITWFIVYVSTFYFHYSIVLPKAFRPLKLRKIVIGLLASFCFFMLLRYVIEQKITVWLFDAQNYYSPLHLPSYLYDNLFYSLQPIIMSTVGWLILFSIRTAAENQQIREERNAAEMKFLKAQINPHFIFNTLNNIYSMVHLNSSNALPAIEKLSEILRFTTYESPKDAITLTKEWEYILAFLSLESLRHTNTNWYTVSVNGSMETKLIAPFILSPFVENAIKHGDCSPKTPLEIELKIQENLLFFRVKNKINTHKKDTSSGVGIDNLKKRLRQFYPDRFDLQLEKNEMYCIAQLKIEGI